MQSFLTDEGVQSFLTGEEVQAFLTGGMQSFIVLWKQLLQGSVQSDFKKRAFYHTLSFFSLYFSEKCFFVLCLGKNVLFSVESPIYHENTILKVLDTKRQTFFQNLFE